MNYENLRDFFNSDYYKQNKNDIIKFIAQEKGIKEASARRNINRMEAYYLGKDVSQKRTGGRDYVKLVSKFNINYSNSYITAGGDFVAIFPDYQKARAYTEGLEGSILHTTYNDKFEPVVIRYYMP